MNLPLRGWGLFIIKMWKVNRGRYIAKNPCGYAGMTDVVNDMTVGNVEG